MSDRVFAALQAALAACLTAVYIWTGVVALLMTVAAVGVAVLVVAVSRRALRNVVQH